jgi:uncharacterized protein (DUF4415 family)
MPPLSERCRDCSHHLGAPSRPPRTTRLRYEVATINKNYDFSKGKRNPYANKRNEQVTIRLDEGTLDYFEDLAEDTGIQYQTRINLFLRDCAQAKKRPTMKWRAAGS